MPPPSGLNIEACSFPKGMPIRANSISRVRTGFA